MGLFGSLRSSSAPDIQDWKILRDLDTLKEAINKSDEKPIVFFKHSTTCGISAAAKHKLEENWDLDGLDYEFYYLDLLSNRDISNAIADKLRVVHQSPQLILIKGGDAKYSKTHHSINFNDLKVQIKKYQ